MGSATKGQKPRFDFRLSESDKELIQQAALLSGQTLTQFARSGLLRLARQTLEEHYQITLSKQEFEAFVEMLEDDRPPTPAAVRAAERYRRHKKYAETRRGQ